MIVLVILRLSPDRDLRLHLNVHSANSTPAYFVTTITPVLCAVFLVEQEACIRVPSGSRRMLKGGLTLLTLD